MPIAARIQGRGRVASLNGLTTDVADATLEEIVERTAAYFESALWESEIGSRVLARLLRAGIGEATLRSFRVGYAPQTRRMREPWIRGKDEWQPTGWTYHRLEEVLVGAAFASAITCLVLLMTVGGFLG